jgi:hypothetical protein
VTGSLVLAHGELQGDESSRAGERVPRDRTKA